MTDFLTRNRAGVLMVFLSFFSILCLTFRAGPYVQGMKTSLWFLVSPEVVYSGDFFNRIDGLSGRFFQLVHAEGENYILRQQNQILLKKEMERDALQDENTRLRAVLQVKEKNFSEAVPAEVTGQDLRDWFHSVILNKGADQEISLAAAVVAVSADKSYLVGRITEVRPGNSKVLLMTDSLSAVSVSVPRTGDIGLLEGRNKQWVFLNYLPLSATVAAGDTVTTVGLGGIFPPGIPVGTVVDVGLTPDGFFKEARVQPIEPLNALREVLVLKRTERVPDPQP